MTVTVEDAERFADGCRGAFDQIKNKFSYGMCNGQPGFVCLNAGPGPYVELGEVMEPTPEEEESFSLRGICDEAIAADLIRDVAGNPFRPAHLDPALRTPAVASLAQAADEERVFPGGHLDLTRLAILSDALEDAGCTDDAILTHLRSPGPHVRGCWALDLVLGKQ